MFPTLCFSSTISLPKRKEKLAQKLKRTTQTIVPESPDPNHLPTHLPTPCIFSRPPSNTPPPQCYYDWILLRILVQHERTAKEKHVAKSLRSSWFPALEVLSICSPPNTVFFASKQEQFSQKTTMTVAPGVLLSPMYYIIYIPFGAQTIFQSWRGGGFFPLQWWVAYMESSAAQKSGRVRFNSTQSAYLIH